MKYIISVILWMISLLFQQAFASMIIKPQTWIDSAVYIGNVKATKSIQLSSEIAGVIAKVNIESGQSVRAGEKIFQLRADTVNASLEKAKAVLLDDQSNYERRRKLLPMHYISLADIDHLKAQVAEDKAELAHQHAIVDQYTITAPFNGVLGIQQVQAGQYINAGQSLVDLESVDPVYVDFAIPEKNIGLIKLGQSVTIKSDAFPNDSFAGVISATSHAVDEASRSLMVRVSVPNPNQLLLTGMAVTVMISRTQDNQMIIPSSAINYTPDGEGVYIMGANKKSHWQSIVISARTDDQIRVASGIHFGDEISTTGKP